MTDAIVLILWGGIEVLLVFTGKLVVAAVSLGRWRGQDLSSKEHLVYGPAGALSFRRDGQRVLTHDGLLFVGVLFYGVLTLGLFSLTKVLP